MVVQLVGPPGVKLRGVSSRPLMPVILAVSMDEPCIGLCEMNLPSGLPGGGIRRYQIIYVVRDDKRAEFKRDLGPAKKFRADQFRIPGAVIDDTTRRVTILHTVGQLVEIANRMREIKPQREIHPTPDLWGQLRRQNEEKVLLRRRASQFGPYLRVQRS